MIFSVEVNGILHKLELEKTNDEGGYRVVLNEQQIAVDARLLREGVLSLIVDGTAYRCVLDEDPIAPAIYVGSNRYPYRMEDPRSLGSRSGKRGPAAGPVSIVAPMPGRVVRVLAQEGDEVASHQGIVVIEAMKMQNELKAPKAGRVSRILVEVGSAVNSGQPLAIIE
jgi:biotin carboxyl carrier protein